MGTSRLRRIEKLAEMVYLLFSWKTEMPIKTTPFPASAWATGVGEGLARVLARSRGGRRGPRVRMGRRC